MTIPLLRNNLADDCGAVLPASFAESPWCWIPRWGEDWGSREETDLLEKNNVSVLWYLETAISFRYCGFLWIRHGGPCVGPCVVILKLYVCVSSGDTSLLQNTRQLWTVSTLLITTGHCLYITWLFPQLSHSSSLVNIHFPQMEMVLRKTAQALDLLSGQAKLGTYGWSQCICSGLLTQPWDPESWSKGVLASPFMPRGTRPPEVQIVSIIVRWAQWSWNPGQT